MAQIGHNSMPSEQLRNLVERIERLEEEKANIGSDIRDVKAEAKANGYDVKALNIVLKRRKMDKQERDELDYNVELYEGVFG